MKKCAFLSCKALTEKSSGAFLSPTSGNVTDDHLLITPLKELGFETDIVSWDDDSINWSDYEFAVVRSTWDYTFQLPRFIKRLDLIESKTRLLNSLKTIRWNANKAYLLELEKKGISIVPTKIIAQTDTKTIRAFAQKHQKPGVVIKPTVGAGALNTFFITDIAKPLPEVEGTEFLLQPLLETIREGELSLIYVEGRFSHGIKKVPKIGDYRSQEEYGSKILEYFPQDCDLEFADEVIKASGQESFFARVDYVYETGKPYLMELELIEPALYFRTKPGSEKNFAKSMVTRCNI